MPEQKEIKKDEYEKLSSASDYWSKIEIPEGATHVEMELDYSSCYYESDQPSMIAHFFKKIN